MTGPSTGLTLRAEGPAAPDEVWERYVNTARWPGWSPQINRVEPVGRIRAGSTGTVFGPLGVRVRFEVDGVDPLTRRWTWRARLGPVRLRLEHWVDPAPGGTVTTLRMRGPLPVVLAYAPLAQLALKRLVA